MKLTNVSLVKYSRCHLILSISLLFSASSCYAPGSYKVGRTGVGSNGALVMMQFTVNHPYVVLHEGDSSWQLSDYRINDDHTKITGTLKELPPERMTYKKVNPKATNIASEANPYPFDEMHVISRNLVPDSARKVIIQYTNIEEIQLYNRINYKKKNATTTAATVSISVGLTILLILAGIAIVAAVIALLVTIFRKLLGAD